MPRLSAHITVPSRLSLDSYGHPILDIASGAPQRGCIFHSDCGSPYCSHCYQKIPHQDRCKVSISGKGNCYDNPADESFFKRIKAEFIWRRSWETRRHAETAIFQYINGSNKHSRQDSEVGGKAPWPTNAKWPKRALGTAQKR